MEISIRMVVVAVIVLLVLVVAIGLITGWFGRGNDLVEGFFKFFEQMLSGNSMPGSGLQKP